MMNKIVGIDLGTTHSLVAVVDSGIPLVLAGRDGARLTPSVVHWPTAGEPLVGAKAKRMRAGYPERTIYSVKRWMGRRGSDVRPNSPRVDYRIKTSKNGPVEVAIGSQSLRPEEISAQILTHLKAIAEYRMEQEVAQSVITVPAYFNDAQRTATKRAGELAGLTVARIINEPTAAALAYGLNRLNKKARIAVYDLGGGTFDLSILELRDGVFEVLSTHGDTQLGGDDLDQELVTFLCETIARQGGPSPEDNPALTSRIREAAEEAKVKLSQVAEVKIQLPFLSPTFSFACGLTRQQLEGLTRHVVARTRSHCLRALNDAQLRPADLDHVILAGGQTRMPLVRRMVAEIFECAEFEETRGGIPFSHHPRGAGGPVLNTSSNPDEVVALGAAIQGAILTGELDNLLLLDVTPLSLGIETFGGLMNVLIPRNSTIPVKAGEAFTTAVDFQSEMLIHVLQGERERARDNWSLGHFTLQFEKARRGVPRVGVQFEIDANGILRVLARDLKTGKEKIVPMKSAVDVEDQEVQKMIEASVEHAFSDLSARQWIENRLKATEVLDATHSAMEDSGGELTEDIRASIIAAVEALTQVLSAADPETQTGNPAILKRATDKLNQVTQPLAELQMQKVAESLFREQEGL